MPTFEFKVKIQANNSDEAKHILNALFDIKKSVETKDLILFANKVKEKPGLVKKAKKFL
jgi:hypothetical protein